MTDLDTDMDFEQIIPRLGSKTEAFEEICCQLARRTANGDFHRLHGAGGDGGIECYADAPDDRCGWQAKYVFEIDALVRQAGRSLDTALAVHKGLTRFVLCFPFDPTGPTARRGRSGTEKLDDWIKEREAAAQGCGRRLRIELWPLSKLRHLLLDHDPSGGLRFFFFGTPALSDDWFDDHLKRAFATAGPRYTPELNVETDLYKWITAFGRGAGWTEAAVDNVSPIRAAQKSLGYVLRQPERETDHDAWPDDTLDVARSLVEHVHVVVEALEDPVSLGTDDYKAALADLSGSSSELRTVEAAIAADLDDRHGPGLSDSPHWRQLMAEYMVSFPAAHLDAVRELAGAVDALAAWLRSPECSLALQDFFVLAGDPGTGKTHGVCDAAARRREEGLRTCIVFGHEFADQPDPWSRVAESLGLSPSLGTDRLLDCLDAAGEASGRPLLICIDAINETKPLSYWRNRIASMMESVRSRPSLRLCVVCKSAYLKRCLPDDADHPVVTHRGFAGMERQACQSYFRHYGLRPPIAPILQPELSNPLYLRLVCETLTAAGLDRLPAGWSGGGTAIIRGFLRQKDSQFVVDFENAHTGAATACLMKIVRWTATAEAAAVPWSTAHELIGPAVSDPHAVLTWLVNEALLIEDVSDGPGWEQDIVLRPAFERLGDFLVAHEVLAAVPDGQIETVARPGGVLHAWLKDAAAIETHRGVLAEFAVLAAEREHGFELPDLATDPDSRDELAGIAVKGLVFRDPSSLTSATAALVRHMLGTAGLAYDAMDAVLSCAWRASSIDAMWLHRLLSRAAMVDRDAFWCSYIHESFEATGVVANLAAAVGELPLDDIEPLVAERWTTALSWFTAAADRRIKDRATRGTTAILTSVPSIIPALVESFVDVDDDEVRERVLLACYGAMLLSRNENAVRETASFLHRSYLDTPADFDNALIRDHIRCICELSVELAPEASRDIAPEAIAGNPASSKWPLELPSDEDVEKWSASLRFMPDSDFFTYSIGCLRPWVHGLSQLDMGKWIAHRVARDFAFFESDCEGYDDRMLHTYGGGRAKPVWAERIAKKYAWIALNQLASRLHDHVERRFEPWEVGTVNAPLILPQRRKLDPTIPEPASEIGAARNVHDWTIPRPDDLATVASPDFEAWLREQVVPTLKVVVRPRNFGDRHWRPLMAYLQWDGAEKDAESGLYRHMWITVQSYLVPAGELRKAYRGLRGHSLFGTDLPRALNFLYGFAAEYPRGAAFEFRESEEQQHLPTFASGDAPVSVVPAWTEVVCEWEYDVSRPDVWIRAPARQLLADDVWWDGRGGFSTPDGSAVFVDPSYRGTGPPALLAEAVRLDERLLAADLSIILTMTGKKMIRARGFGRLPDLPRLVFSQVGFLHERTARFDKPVFVVE